MTHAKPNSGVQCRECYRYHYVCAECNSDCTVGEKAGPATKGVDGITRCRECAHEANVAWLHRQHDCVAALEGIKDPAKFVARAQRMEEIVKRYLNSGGVLATATGALADLRALMAESET